MKSFLSKDIFLLELCVYLVLQRGCCEQNNNKYEWKKSDKDRTRQSQSGTKTRRYFYLKDGLIPSTGHTLDAKSFVANQRTVLCKERAARFARRVD